MSLPLVVNDFHQWLNLYFKNNPENLPWDINIQEYHAQPEHGYGICDIDEKAEDYSESFNIRIRFIHNDLSSKVCPTPFYNYRVTYSLLDHVVGAELVQ